MMRIVIFAWLVFLYYLSMAPFEVKSHFRTMGHMHNLGHVLAFLITTLLLAWNCRTILSLLLYCALVFGIALGVEWLEFVSYHNPYEWGDVFIDGIGISLAFLVLAMVLSQRGANETKRTATRTFP